MAESRRLVHMVDDDAAIRRSASFMLRTSGYEVKTYASGEDFLSHADLAPGCVLVDVRMPGIDGLEVQAELRKRGVFYPVVIMTGHGQIALAVEAMKGGAIDFVEKPFEKNALTGALDEGFARLANSDRQALCQEQATAKLKVLTPRERDVLDGLVRGHPNKTIAYDLGISPRTVEIHRANVMSKLAVSSLSEALRIAFAAGLGSGSGDG
jgi:two-component system response regulator FixJ